MIGKDKQMIMLISICVMALFVSSENGEQSKREMPIRQAEAESI